MFKIALATVLGLFTASSSFASPLYICQDVNGTSLSITSMPTRAGDGFIQASLKTATGEVNYFSETTNVPPADFTFEDNQNQIATVQFSTSQWTTPCGRCNQPIEHAVKTAKWVYQNQTLFLNCK